MRSDYSLISRWTVACSRAELWSVLDGLLASEDPMAWWPAVEVQSYDKSSMAVQVSSGLGYTLTFTMIDLEVRQPESLAFAAVGDLRGTGSVTFHQLDGASTRMDIVWAVATNRRWMRWTGWLLRPVFVAGHRLVMRRGEKQLNGWLSRRV